MHPDDHEHTLYRDDSEYTAEQVVPDAIEGMDNRFIPKSAGTFGTARKEASSAWPKGT